MHNRQKSFTFTNTPLFFQYIRASNELLADMILYFNLNHNNYGALYRLVYYTGMRFNEAYSIEIDDFLRISLLFLFVYLFHSKLKIELAMLIWPIVPCSTPL